MVFFDFPRGGSELLIIERKNERKKARKTHIDTENRTVKDYRKVVFLCICFLACMAILLPNANFLGDCITWGGAHLIETSYATFGYIPCVFPNMLAVVT